MEVTLSSSEREAGAVTVRDAAHVGTARRLCRRLAEAAGADADLVERAALATTELASNLVAHAGGGWVHLRASERALEIVSVDRGPGLGDAKRAFRDGFSTGGTGGTGLGAVRRLSRELDFESSARGTVLVARLGIGEDRAPRRRLGGLVAAYPGEPESGDGLLVGAEGPRVVAVVVDGLGHGQLARGSRERALEAVAHAPRGALEPEALLARMHEAMGRGDGAAASVAIVEPRARRLTFAGLGNVAARLIRPAGRAAHLVPTGGIVGRAPMRARAETFAWEPGSVLVMHSDGLTARWQAADYPWARRRDPALLAGVLMRDLRRTRDDASVLVLQEAA